MPPLARRVGGAHLQRSPPVRVRAGKDERGGHRRAATHDRVVRKGKLVEVTTVGSVSSPGCAFGGVVSPPPIWGFTQSHPVRFFQPAVHKSA
jgi:hypothetical protein